MALLTEEEVEHYLSLKPGETKELVKRGKLTAYKLGGAYLRFHKDEVLALKSGKKFTSPDQIKQGWTDQFRDFWKFNNFYILSSILILLLVVLFFQL